MARSRRARPYLLIIGADSRSRTHDLLITNQLLYQLSYAGTVRGYFTICNFGLGLVSALPFPPSAGAAGGLPGESPGWPGLKAKP